MARARAERTCVGCRGRARKDELVRVASSANGVQVDPAGSAAGRGAYVHLDAGCIDATFAHRALASALRTGVTAEEADRLRHDLDRLMGAV
jgi:predicted RNA-binding protein YlxR (DUF448 family)